MRAAVYVAACLLVAGCGSSDPVPQVDWSKVPAGERAQIDGAIKHQECDDLQFIYQDAKRKDLRAYLDWQMRHDACY